MDIAFAPAAAGERACLEALFELYVYDFSEVLGLDVDDDGRFRAPSLEAYWTEAGCHPFLFRAGGKLAGFALVREQSRLSGARDVRDVAEFFVLRRYRRQRIGERAAAWIFDRFPGPWEVREGVENRAGTAFWRQVIGRYTAGRFEDLTWDDDRWRGPVQRFVSAPRVTAR